MSDEGLVSAEELLKGRKFKLELDTENDIITDVMVILKTIPADRFGEGFAGVVIGIEPGMDSVTQLGMMQAASLAADDNFLGDSDD